jgi:hypothetical protein
LESVGRYLGLAATTNFFCTMNPNNSQCMKMEKVLCDPADMALLSHLPSCSNK